MKKNLLLAGLLVGGSAHAAIVTQDLANKVMQVGDEAKVLFMKVKDRDFSTLENDLNNFLMTAKDFIAKNLDTFNGDVVEAINIIPVKQIPPEYKQAVMTAQQDAKNALPMAINAIRNNLSKVGSNEVRKLVQGLQYLRENAPAVYMQLQDELQEYYNTTLAPIIATISKAQQLGFKDLQNAESIVNKLINGGDANLDELNTVARAYAQLNRLMPLIPQLVRGTTELVNTINDKFNLVNDVKMAANKLPDSVVNALKTIKDYAMKFEGTFTNAANSVKKAIANLNT